MKRLNKIQRIINFIKNEGKFNRTDYVQVLKNNSDYETYDKYVGQCGIVTNIDYSKKECMVGLKFLDGENLDFDVDEIVKLDEKYQYSEDYKKLLFMI